MSKTYVVVEFEDGRTREFVTAQDVRLDDTIVCADDGKVGRVVSTAKLS